MTRQPNEQSNDVRVEIEVEAPIEHAFKVFTEQGGTWWPSHYSIAGGNRADVLIEPRVGGRWYEVSTDGKECDWGQVLAWDTPEHVALSWQISPQFGPEDPARASRVDVRFVADGPQRTKVTLVHSDFERHGAGWPAVREGVANEGGWPGVLAAYAKLAAA